MYTKFIYVYPRPSGCPHGFLQRYSIEVKRKSAKQVLTADRFLAILLKIKHPRTDIRL